MNFHFVFIALFEQIFSQYIDVTSMSTYINNLLIYGVTSTLG